MESSETYSKAINQDEHIMAALAHGSILLPMTGVIVPIVIWITQREKSRYVAFQSLQALLFQLILIVAWVLGMGCYMLSIFSMVVAVIPLSQSPGIDQYGGIFTLFPFGVLGVSLCAGALFVIYGLVGAIMTLQGTDFRYLLIGNFIKQRWSSGHPDNGNAAG
jgi:uncharacterized Tic20 family protein